MTIAQGEVRYKIVADTSDYKKGIKDVESSTTTSQSKAAAGFTKMKALGVAAWAAVGAGVIAVGKKIIDVVKQSAQAYAEYQQLVGGVETLFGTRGAKDLQEYARMVGKTTKEASGEFKMLQQSQSLVMDNASKAYKTAGMSMNQYMGTVTSFAASLKQSAKNEYEAAKIADMAVLDMADNANKMGTSIESIQIAYQGFAKNSYAMLDNLKLGYGGSQTEMKRLLSDAEKLTGIKYDISSLSDVYQAIHVIQEELGITGTTAKEAMETVEGSALMMKAAWENLLIGMGDKNADVGKLTDDLADSIMTWLGNIAPVVGTVVLSLLKVVGRLILKGLQAGVAKLNELLKGALKKLGNLILDLLKGALNGILSFFKKIWEEIKQAVLTIAAAIASGLKKIWEGIKAAATTVWNGIKSFLTGVWEGLRATATAIWTGVSSFFSAIWTGISTAASTIWGGIKSFLTGVWEGLSSTASSIWGGIQSFLSGVWEGLSGTASTIWGGIKDTITNAWTAVSEKASPVWDGITNTVTNAWNAAKANAENIWGKIGETVRSAWEAISSTIASKAETIGAKVRDLWDGARSKFSDFGNWVRDTFSGIFEKAIKKIVVTIGLLVTKIHLKFMELKGKLYEAGQNIIEGLKNGINSRAKSAENTIQSVAARMAAAARIKLAIQSPSKVFKEIGLQIINGLKKGIEAKANMAVRATVDVVGDLVESAKTPLRILAANTGDGDSIIPSIDKVFLQPLQQIQPALAGIPQNSIYNSSNNFSISKLADNITVRSNEDIDKISDALYQRILFEKRARGLQG